MIGLAFSKLGGDTQNIGYIIPNEEIELFLKDIAVDGHYHGKPAMYDELQTLENPALREYLKLDKSVEGMVVHRPDKTDASYPLKEWDVLTRIGDVPIDNQGMVKLDKDLRVSFAYQIQHLAKDGKVPMTLVRGGKVHARSNCRCRRSTRPWSPTCTAATRRTSSTVRWCFRPPPGNSSSNFENNAGPDADLGRREKSRWSPAPSIHRMRKRRNWWSSPRLSSRTSSPTAIQTPPGRWCNPSTARTCAASKHLVAVLRDLKDPFVTIEFDQKGNEALVFSRAAMLAATDEILTDNGVRAQGSPNMMAVWQAKGAN